MEDKYKKLDRLGKGATAEVYLVEEVATGKKYAMKVYENSERLKVEAELMQELGGGVFPAFAECFEEEKALVMEYLEGCNLQQLLDEGDQLETGEAVYIMEGILRALSILHMHHPSIVYRDLKPANVMLDKEGRIRLIDLGAACYEGEKTKAGTYGYAAPEQFWEGVKSDKACDIYSAGKVLAYLLSGKNPVEPPYDMESYCKGLKKVDIEFVEIIERSLAVNPAGRYEDCESMCRAIKRAYLDKTEKKWFRSSRKTARVYKKCIWKSEYRRIF